MAGPAQLSFHPIADVFPLIEGREFEELVADIGRHGLREPIVLHADGRVLDGRNRYRACVEAGADPSFVTYRGPDPVGFAVSLNLRRRHLNESQRAMVAAKIANLDHGQRADHAAERAANLPLLPLDPPPSARAAMTQQQYDFRRQGMGFVAPAPVSQPDAARMLNVSERSVRAATAVRDHAVPELARKVEAGQVSVSAAADVAKLAPAAQSEIVAKGEREILEAAKQIRADKAAARRADNEALKASLPVRADGKYGVIVIDPPWDMQKIERDVRPNQVGFDYPTMTEADLAAFGVAEMAADDCHLFCWTTQRFLPAALRLVEGWGFRYVLTMVWHKAGGFQPIGLPQYNCEFVVYARKGAPSFADTKAFPCCFSADRREHSRKPDEFYDTIRRVANGPRIDVFSREMREGFAQFGNETSKFAGAA